MSLRGWIILGMIFAFVVIGYGMTLLWRERWFAIFWFEIAWLGANLIAAAIYFRRKRRR